MSLPYKYAQLTGNLNEDAALFYRGWLSKEDRLRLIWCIIEDLRGVRSPAGYLSNCR